MHAWRSDAALPTQERASKRWEAERGCEERRGAVTQTEACKISAPPPPQKKQPPPLPSSCFPAPHIAAGVDVSPGRAAEHLARQQTCFLGEGWAAPSKCPLLCGKAVP